MTAIDRTRPPRPPGRAGGWQRWRTLLFLHWPVPVEALRPLVPAALELDLFEGVAYVGVVPFAMFDVRPSWLPRFAAMDFLETNVRTYVRAGALPGVHFFSLEAESRLAVTAARATFGLPYFHARMRLEQRDGAIEYETVRTSGRRPRLHVRYRPGAESAPSELGTLQHFLVERYHLFVERGGRIWRGQVFHEPYPVASASVVDVADELMAAARLPAPSGPPLAHFSPGVDVEVFNLERTLDEPDRAQ